MKCIEDRVVHGNEDIDKLISIGMMKETEPNEDVAELLRVFWKGHAFREWDFSTGIQKKLTYSLMQEIYQDYECQLPYSMFIELFPIIDELFVQASIKKASIKK